MKTMKDIARDLGVSVVTVSKVLRNHQDIGKKTRERVLQRVHEVGYKPNLTARSLVTGHSSLVGLLVPDLLHPFFAEVAKSLASTLRKAGYYLLICSSEEDPELERAELEHLLGRRIDALVIASVGVDRSIFNGIQIEDVPIVFIDREIPDVQTHFLGVNDFSVGMMATEHLIAQGCKRIAHIRGTSTSTGLRRLEGYTAALKKHAIRLNPNYIVSIPTIDIDSKARGEDAMKQLLRLKTRPDGVFCFSDPVGIGAMKATLDQRLRIPQDIAFVGCGNLHYNENLRVPLSSIDQDSHRIGERAGSLLLKIFESKTPLPPSKIIIKPRLVVRESSKRTNNRAS